MLGCCCLPVHLVLLGPCMYCGVVLHMVSLHCSFMFTYPLLQSSSCFSNIDNLTFGAWYLIHNSFLLPLWLRVFFFAPRLPFDLKIILMPRHLLFLPILSLTPLTYGKWRNLRVVVCSCSSVRVEEGDVWAFPEGQVHHLCWVPICFRWFRSPISLVACQTFLALVPRHLIMSMVVRVIVYISICVCLSAKY